MKLKNVKVGNLLYLKTYEEVQQSRYFSHIDEEDLVFFVDNSSLYSKHIDGKRGGSLIEVIEVSSDSIRYLCNFFLTTTSRHAFRKPTKKELEDYETNN